MPTQVPTHANTRRPSCAARPPMSGVASSVTMPVSASVTYAQRSSTGTACGLRGDRARRVEVGAQLLIELMRHATRPAVADRAIVDAHHRHDVHGRADEEQLVDRG